jgi:phospholipid/cholesterol/gamma-HCH transport system ATP-binding protein
MENTMSAETKLAITGKRPEMSDPAIVVKDLTVNFGDHKVLDGISFEVKRGSTLVILGLSGVGKSTILRCLTGLLQPTSGEVLINHHDLAKMKVKELVELRRRIGMAFQRAALFDSMTVGENVAFGLREHTKLSNEDIERIVKEKLKIVDLEGMEDHFPSELSGGMQKRASFARTIATEPDLIFYDEPTTGLDPIITRVINQLILDLQQRTQATSVVVTHDLGGAMMVGHQILMLHEGRIVWTGPAKDFETTTNPYVVQFREGRADGPIRV